MPETRMLLLTEIDQPATAARVAMDDVKFAELRESMRATGQLQAIGVIDRAGRYEIRWGHRRYLCAAELGWSHIRAEVWHASEVQDHAGMLAENIFREDLSAAEEALLFAEHQEKDNLDEAGLCARFHVSPDYLGDRMRLLRQDQEVFKALLARKINFSVARELNKCTDEDHRRYLLDVAITTGYSAAVMASHVRQWRANCVPGPAVVPSPVDASAPQPVAAYVVECALCGGSRDPWNLVSIMIHRREWEAIQEQLERAAKETPCESSAGKTNGAEQRA